MDWALVGREAELRRLTAVLADPRRGVVLAGPAGVGKTRLAQECGRRATGPGRPLVTVTAVPGAEAGRLGAFATKAVAAAGGSGVILVVDDAHLLDEASAAVVHQLAACGAAVVVAAVLVGASAPEPVVALWKDGLAERVDLAPLEEDALTALIAAAVGGPVDETAVAVFAHLCQGNLVFLRELLRGAVDDGALRDQGGLWRLVAPAPLTPALAQLIDRGMGPLSAEERELLEAVAVAEPLGPGELRALGDPGVVEDLARRGLLARTLSGRRIEVRSGEPLFGRRLRSEMPPLVAARIARSLVEATEKTGGRRREDTLRIAWWGFEAGLPRPRLMLAAARAARWRHDFPLAERLARVACEDGAEFEAEVLAAQLAYVRGRARQKPHRLGPTEHPVHLYDRSGNRSDGAG